MGFCFICQKCGNSLQADDDSVDMMAQCPYCGENIKIPPNQNVKLIKSAQTNPDSSNTIELIPVTSNLSDTLIDKKEDLFILHRFRAWKFWTLVIMVVCFLGAIVFFIVACNSRGKDIVTYSSIGGSLFFSALLCCLWFFIVSWLRAVFRHIAMCHTTLQGSNFK